MISVDKARQLKESGLLWDIKYGDFYWDDKYGEVGIVSILNDGIKREYIRRTYLIWLPRLDQLLDEIEQRNYLWLVHNNDSSNEICVVIYPPYPSNCIRFRADTPEDAAAKALLWILQREADKNDQASTTSE